MNDQEIATLRSYLATQSMRRPPAQLIEILQATYHELTQALNTLPDALFHTRPQATEWSAAEILAHIHTILPTYQKAICLAIERGEQPEKQTETISGAINPSLQSVNKEYLLTAIAASLQQLSNCVLQADPDTHLHITWEHFELGPLHWREWLLFLRVHLLVHARQMQDLIRLKTQ